MKHLVNLVLVLILVGLTVFLGVIVADLSGFWPADPKQATMPDEFVAKLVKDLPDGQEGHFDPTMLVVDLRGKVWIYDTAQLKETSYSLKVKRVGEYFEILARPDLLKHGYVKTQVDQFPICRCLPVSKLQLIPQEAK